MSYFYDEEDEEDDENEEEIEEGGYDDSEEGYLANENAQNSQPQNKSLAYKMKHPLNTLKEGLRIGAKNYSKSKKKKSKIKEIWKKLPLKVKIIIISAASSVVLIVTIIILIGDLSARSGVNNRSKGVTALNINEESTEASQLALELYNKYDSLIGFTTDELNTIYQSFLEDNSNGNRYLLTSGKKSFGEDTGEKYTINQKLTLYQHIQRTEKYNFNEILWREYTHTTDDVPIETELNESLELYIPKNSDQETINTLLKTTAPYLLTQDIPLGILSGMVGYSGGTSTTQNTTAEKFTYQIIKEALSKIMVNKYVLETITLQSSYDNCDYNTYKVMYTVNVYENGYEELVSETTPELQETRNEITEEKKIDNTESYSYDTYWYVKEAFTYDRIINNTFNYTKYSQSDVDSLTNPDSNTLINTIPIDELSEIKTAKSVNSSPGIPKDKDGNPKAPTGQATREYIYVQKQGNTFVYEKEWKDKLSAGKSENKEYTYDTAVEYNTKTEDTYTDMQTDKTLISEDTFKKDNPSGSSIFDRYVKEDSSTKLYGMSIIDLMNSNSGIYSKYLGKNSNSSTYVGIDRAKLKSSYNEVKNILNSLLSKQNSDETTMEFNSYTTGYASEDAIPFVYGSSLGYNSVYFSVSGNSSGYVSGISLLREYLRSLEGIGSSLDPASTEIVEEGDKQYYVVAANMTVGYGVDLSQNTTWKTEMEQMIGTTISAGTKIECEIVDQYEENYMMEKYNSIKNAYPELTEYQIHALVVRAYNTGNVDGYAEHKSEYNEATDNLYESVYEEFKDNQTATSSITAKANKDSVLYLNYMSKPTTAVESDDPNYLLSRRLSEWYLFSLGYYDRLQKFYTAGGGSPAGIDLLNSDGSVNESAVAELCTWYEDNIFGGYFHGNDYVIDSLPDGVYYSAKTLEAAKYVQGEFFQMTGIDTATSPYKAVSMSGLGIFQCTWWADARARLYLQEAGYTGNVSTRGDGGQVAPNFSTDYNIALNTDINAIRANSIASFGTSGHGHVVYIEAVGTNGYVISHCGSGHVWHGVDIIPLGTTVFSKSFNGSVCLDDLL